ncbi:phosphorylase family protein [Desulfocurvus sp. DL9XJH121]
MKDKSEVNRFLSSFQGDTRNNISTFCRLLWDSEYDYYIFMARKAACFFDCLQELGIGNVRGEALTDRILDTDLEFIENKKILLVDDCIFTGTTLFKATEIIKKARCESFNTFSLAINVDAIRQNLLPGGDEWEDLRIIEPVFKMSDSDCVRQCHDIVRAISILPRPYDVDFPHTEKFKLKENAFSNTISLLGWSAVECSSQYQKANDVCIFTIIPNKHTAEYFWNLHDVHDHHSYHAKIRLYAKKNNKTGSYTIRIVPIVILPSLSNDDIENALNAINIWDKNKIFTKFTSPKSKYRFLHYIIAHRFLNFYFSHLITVNKTFSLSIRQDLMEMSFGKNFFNEYKNAANLNNKIYITRTPNKVAETRKGTIKEAYKKEFYNDDENAIVSNLIEPFKIMYKEKELPTRDFIKENGLKEKDGKCCPHANRLLEGITFLELSGIPGNGSIEPKLITSITLDRLIDSGVAVPIIVEKKCQCYRAFRHGEDAILGEAEEKILIEAFKAFSEATGFESTWGLVLSKLIVLVIQIGIRTNLFTSIKLSTPVPESTRIVSIMGHLHGPVPIVRYPTDPSGNMGAPFIAGNIGRKQWLLSYWVKKGYISKQDTGNGRLYSLIKSPKLTLGNKSDAKARQIGRCIGTAIAEGGLDNNYDLVMLGTCTESDHMLRSLSGEIAIFQFYWTTLRKDLSILAKENKFKEAHNTLRNKYNVFTALNSGAMKHKWYTSHSTHATNVERLIRQVETNLIESGNTAMADEWVQLWPTAYPINNFSGSYVWKYITECGQKLILLNIALRLIDLWIVFMAVKNNELRKKSLTSAVKDVKEWIDKAEHAFEPSKQPFFLNDCKQSIDNFTNKEREAWKISKLGGQFATIFAVQEAKPLLDQLTAICNAYGDVNGEQTLPHAIYFDSEESAHQLYTAICNGISILKIEDPYYLPDNYNPFQTGFWILLPGSRNSLDPAKLAKIAIDDSIKNGYRIKILLIGQLSKNESITRFSKSTEIAKNFFFYRLSQISRIYNIANEPFGTYIFANEQSDKSDSESKKLLSLTDHIVVNEKNYRLSNDDSDNLSLPEKQFTIAIGKTNRKQSAAKKQSQKTILICTATDKEDDALKKYSNENRLHTNIIKKSHGTYRSFGIIGDFEVVWVRSGMGSSGPSGSFATTMDAIDDLSPTYIISCGLAFGADEEKQKIGDVLVSEWIRCYEKGRQGEQAFTPRGQRADASSALLQASRSLRIDHKGSNSIFTGGFLSGDKLVDDPNFKRKIFEIEPEAIGGDMEGAGILDACSRRNIPWIVIKSITDWGENKTSDKQPMAALNAFTFAMALIRASVLP